MESSIKTVVVGGLSELVIDDSSTDAEFYSQLLSDESFRTHPVVGLPDDTVWGLPARNRLRKDSTQVLYYGNSLFDVWSCRLLPQQVVCLSLFDGRRALREIAEAVAFLSDCNYVAADLKVRYFLKVINAFQSGKFVDLKKYPTAPIQTFQVEDYLVENSALRLRLDAPLSLILMPTDKCLTDCTYCYACRRPIAEENFLSLRRIEELISEAKELGVSSVNLDGGDFFARKEHMAILEWILNAGMEPTISTKAYISKEKAAKLAELGLKWIQIGLDSTRDMCDRLVQRSGYFDRTVESIFNLTNAGIRTRTNSIITRESLPYLPDLVDFLMTLPLSDIKVAPAFLGIYRGDESLLLTADQKKWFRSTMEEKEKQYPTHKINWECDDDIIDADVSVQNGWFRDRPYCSSGRTQIVITPDGKVTTCEQSPQEGVFICGDVTHQSIMDVWNSDALKEWFEPPREEFRGTACHDCVDFQPCVHGMGHCWLQVYKMQGRLHAPHPYCPKAERPTQRWR